MRNRDDPAVLAHLEAENGWTRQRTAHLEPLRQRLYAEFRARLQEDDASVPAPHGPWAYYRRYEAGSAYAIHCRRPVGAPDGPEHVLLDVNQLAQGRAFVSVPGIEWSPDHARIAYPTDFVGDERYTMRVRDLATGADLPDTFEDTRGDVAWVDDHTLFVTKLDASQRPFQVWSHRLGEPGSARLVYQEDDERFRVSIGRSRSGRFVVLSITNVETTEIRLVPTDAPETPPVPVFSRSQGARYQVVHAGDRLMVISNVGADGVPGSAVNGRLLELPCTLDGLPLDSVESAPEAVERLAHRAGVQLVGMAGFATHCALVERDRGQLGLRVVELDGTDRPIPLPEQPCVAGLGENHDWESRVLQIEYGSMTTPHTILSCDLDAPDFAIERLKEAPVPGYDRRRYRTERVEATAADGTAVPMSLVYRADLDLGAGSHPTILYGYGSYGISTDPMFQSARVSLLDRGVVYVIAHVRGGGDLGRPWYESGKLAQKQNTFTDFVTAAQHLVQRGITAPDRLVAAGGSAGGLLVGAAMNLAPELFRAVLASVPFVDVLTTMLDPDLPLTAGEWDEWGDPREREWFDVIHAYSPFDNVAPVDYPDVLATAGLTDPRVQYWEPAKWIARLRKVATRGEFLLRTELEAGHQGPSGRYGALEQIAFNYAWMLDRLGLVEG